MKTMKTTSAILLAVFLFALTSTTSAAAIVVDSNGNPVKNGGEYFMSTTDGSPVTGGAVRRGSDVDCSLAVIIWFDRWSINISSPLKTLYISENIPLNISFAHFAHDLSTKSRDWVVIKSSPIREPVMVGSDEEFPGSVVDGYFSIASVGSSKRHYKLIFCHTDGECGNIGLTSDIYHIPRLHVTADEPLVFQFRKFGMESSNPKLSMVAQLPPNLN